MSFIKTTTLISLLFVTTACGSFSADTSNCLPDSGEPIVDTDTGIVDPTQSTSTEHGTLNICYDYEWGEDRTISFEGTVLHINDSNSTTNCSQHIAVELADGSVLNMGYSVVDATQTDVSPELDLEVGQSISGIFKSQCSWGCDTSLMIEDNFGIVLIADQGLNMNSVSSDIAPIQVQITPEAYQSYIADSCTEIHEFSIAFLADESIEIVPLHSELITIQGQSLHATAISAQMFEDTPNCSTWIAAIILIG